MAVEAKAGFKLRLETGNGLAAREEKRDAEEKELPVSRATAGPTS